MTKPMLPVNDLIAHMQDKGIVFTIMSVDDAKTYLHKNNNYFKLTSYRKNYTKYTTGMYAGKYEKLEFAYLVELARIDVQLRHIILGICLDIEHFLKVELIKAIENDPKEDGYSIVLDYLFDISNSSIDSRTENAAVRSRSLYNKLRYNTKNPYCGGLISKYNDKMPVWAYVEIISFGDLLRFVDYVAKKIGWVLPVDIQSLNRVRQIRNATAHNNCIINDLSAIYNNGKPDCNEPIHITKFVRQSGVSKARMIKKLSNRRISQIIHLFYAYDMVVTSSNSRETRLLELKALFSKRIIQNKDYFLTNNLVSSTFELLSEVVINMD